MLPFLDLPLVGFAVRSHTLALAAATVAALLLGYGRIVRVERLDRRRTRRALLILLVAAFAGGRLHFVLANWSSDDQLWLLLTLSAGGLHAPGALAGAFAAGIVALPLCRLPAGRFGDALAPSAALGIAIARLGCFANGCCFGGRCHLPWGVHLPAASGVSSAAATPALHPLPLYFAATAAGLTLLLLWKGRRKQYDGQLVLWLLFALSLSGAVLEPLRHDPSRVYWGALPQLLWVNGAMTVLSSGLLLGTEISSRRGACGSRAASELRGPSLAQDVPPV